MSTSLTTTQQKLARIEPQFQAIDACAGELRELVVANDGSPSAAIRQAAAMQSLRELLTPEVMAPIMSLQGNPLGFLTDKDKDGGYSADVIRDVTIECLGRGGQMTRNFTNVISSRYYATKWQFAAWLDNAIGRGNWYFCHGIPKLQRGEKMKKDFKTGQYSKTEGIVGAILETEIKWLQDGKWHSQTLTHCIKGDEYIGADAYNGKADRKCGAWLYCRVTGMAMQDGEVDPDVIEVKATDVAPDAVPADVQSVVDQFTHPDPDATPAPEATEAAETKEAAMPHPAVMAEKIGVPLAVLKEYAIAQGMTVTSFTGVSRENREAMLADPVATKAAINAWMDAQNQG